MSHTSILVHAYALIFPGNGQKYTDAASRAIAYTRHIKPRLMRRYHLQSLLIKTHTPLFNLTSRISENM
ncbi:hypothetical protein JB92DRAFT_2985201 [Gautieria morchelliformis]|nr:hypothetical protein JB92DRAFT_2985201 [Gautieria morchelliformis]